MLADTVLSLLRALLALGLSLGVARTAWRAACAWVGDGEGRGAAALTLGAAAITLGTHVLLAAGAFSALGCAALMVALSLASRALPASPLPTPRVDPSVGVAALATSLVVAWRWLRGSVSPALAPDSLTYHLYRAARWVQLGHDAPEDWPDAAGYYEFFPTGAELFWSHALALTGEDLCVATVGVMMLGAVSVAGWSLSRASGATATRAALAACLVTSLPAAVSVALTGYADVWTLATFLLAATHARLAVEDHGAAHGPLALLAAALHLLAKPSGAPAAAAFAAVGLWAIWRNEPSRRRGALVALGAVAMAAPPLLRAWGARGSPWYPLSAAGFGEGNPQLAALLAGRFSPPAAEPSAGELLRAFTVGLANMDIDPPGWGVAWIVALPLAAASVMRGRGRGRLVGALALLLALASAAALRADALRELRTAFLPFSPRLLLTLPAVAICLGATLGSPRWDRLWLLLALLSVPLAWPRALSPATSAACLAAAPWLLFGAVLTAVAARVRAAPRLALAALALSVGFVGLRSSRGRHRAAILRDMGGAPGARAYEVNPVGGAMRVFWSAGDALVRDCARRTAVAFGWAPPGHRIFRYPLLGQRFQNTLVYVPVTVQGEVVDLGAEALLAPRVDPGHWYARLVTTQVDHVVVSPPYPRELHWMLSRPSLFEPIAPEAAPLAVFRVKAVHRCPR